MRKTWLRLMRIAPLALLLASVASAQTTGTIIGVVTDASTGKPVPGAVVVASSPSMQGEQTAVTDAAGNYRITLLPPGMYRLSVQLEGFKPAERSDISISPDKTIRAPLAIVPEAVRMEEQVVRTGAAAPAVNVGSAESGAVVSREFIASVPVARGYEQIATVAPTARADRYGVSFAGAQSPENAYIVDGLNTSDPAYGTRGTLGNTINPALRNNFIQELDVKTSGFGAEYGRATGGVLNAVVKSGSNEYHGSVFSSLTPDFWTGSNGQTQGQAGQAIAYMTTPKDGAYNLDFGAEMGGPIMKDKLWFYAGFAPIFTKTTYQRYLRSNNGVFTADQVTAGASCPVGTSSIEGLDGSVACSDANGNYSQTAIPGTTQKISTSTQAYQWVGKLTYLLNENNTFTVSGNGTPQSTSNLNASIRTPAMYTSDSNRLRSDDFNSTSILGRYGGKFLEKKLIGEVQVGFLQNKDTPKDRTDVAGFSQLSTPWISWDPYLSVTRFGQGSATACPNDASCPVQNFGTGGREGNFASTANRYVGKASATYLFEALGPHAAKGGIDLERIEYDITKGYVGGASYRYRTAGRFDVWRGFGGFTDQFTPGSTSIIQIPSGTYESDATKVFLGTATSKSRSDSFAYFLQDSWQLPQNITLNYGMRLETQSMENLKFKGQGFSINNNWSPRVQGIWDFTGRGAGKIAGSWGRYFYALPLDAGDRAFGSEQQVRYRYAASGCGGFAGVDAGNLQLFNPKGIPLAANSAGTGCTLQPYAGTGGDGIAVLTGGGLTPGEPVDPKLQGAYVDQFGAQAEYEVFPDVSVGVSYDGRRQGTIIEDMSATNGNTYFVANPGRDINIPDPNSPTGISNSRYVTAQDPVTGQYRTLVMPKPERSYDALTFRVLKTFSKNWLFSGAYTIGYLRGNYAGPFRAEDNQLDPGITSEYDLATLMVNKKGYLPGDQRHQFKFFGSYTWNATSALAVTGGGAFTATSGTPVSVLGSGFSDFGYGETQTFLVPRGQGGRTPWLTQFDLRGQVQYTIKPPYAISFYASLFNVFNTKTGVIYDQNFTLDDVNPIQGANCKDANAVDKGVNKLIAACPDLAYVRTYDGRKPTINTNWGRPFSSTPNLSAFQIPLSLQLGVAMSF
jgi:hypothetical protein